METAELLEIISRDEDSRHQFKADVTNEISLGQEMVAFSNSGGGAIFIGVSNDGTFAGLKKGRHGPAESVGFKRSIPASQTTHKSTDGKHRGSKWACNADRCA